MDKLLDLLKGSAPALATTLATAAGGPIAGKIVGTIASMIGAEPTVESVTDALEKNPELALRLKEIDLEQFKAEAADRDSARHMQIAALQQDSWFAKNFIYLFATVWSAFAMAYFSFVTFGEIPERGLRFADTILGVLIGTVLTGFFGFFFGSSKGSQDKTAALLKGGR